MKVGLFFVDNGRVGGKHKIDARVGDQVLLELLEASMGGAVETERSCEGGHQLCDDVVEVSIGWSLNVKISFADALQGLVAENY